MEFDDTDVAQLVEDIWGGMLGLPVKMREAPAETDGGRNLSALVQLSGDWDGAVAVNCPEGLARKVAAVMFGVEAAETSEADIHDAIGEVANMTAGTVKGLVDGYCRLSLPTVTGGIQMSISMPGSRVVKATAFDCEDSSFSVVVVEKA